MFHFIYIQKFTYLVLTYLLTYSMVQSPSWEANWFAASQEIPRISLNPKVHYRTHKRPPPVSILGQPNPVHTPTSHLLEIRPKYYPPIYTEVSPVVSFPPVSPPRPYTPPPLLNHTRHMHYIIKYIYYNLYIFYVLLYIYNFNKICTINIITNVCLLYT